MTLSPNQTNLLIARLIIVCTLNFCVDTEIYMYKNLFATPLSADIIILY